MSLAAAPRYKVRPSFVPTKTMTSVTLGFETARQPSTTRPTFVFATLNLSVTDSFSIAQILMDASNPPTTPIGRMVNLDVNAAQAQTVAPVAFLVPPGFYYKLHNAGSTNATVDSLFEYAL